MSFSLYKKFHSLSLCVCKEDELRRACGVRRALEGIFSISIYRAGSLSHTHMGKSSLLRKLMVLCVRRVENSKNRLKHKIEKVKVSEGYILRVHPYAARNNFLS
jgi:hypothetical protein